MDIIHYSLYSNYEEVDIGISGQILGFRCNNHKINIKYGGKNSLVTKWNI